MRRTAVYDSEFKSRPTGADRAAAERMGRRMHAGVLYTLGRSGEMRFDRRTGLFLLFIHDPGAGTAIVAASGDGSYIALQGLLNCDRNGWVAQAAHTERTDEPRRTDPTHVEVLRFDSEDQAAVYYVRSRSLRRTVSPPFQNAHGVWCVTHIHQRA